MSTMQLGFGCTRPISNTQEFIMRHPYSCDKRTLFFWPQVCWPRGSILKDGGQREQFSHMLRIAVHSVDRLDPICPTVYTSHQEHGLLW
jgi:hypothetical protein